MTTTYTKISKASGTTYKKVGGSGEPAWDDPTLAWDGSSAWDGQIPYTKITKSSGTTYTKITKAT